MAGMSGDAASGAPWQRRFLRRHGLPSAYLGQAEQWFDPLAAYLLRAAARAGAPPLLVGVNGCQGSGKSTLCDYLAERLRELHSCTVVVLSLDDFYLTRVARQQLAETVHPLLATRGVPGTHDVPLLRQTLDALGRARDGDRVLIPRFDKALDERRPEAARDTCSGPVDLVLLEGWCLGVRPQASLEPAINPLESVEDADGVWRRYVNHAIAQDFLPLYPHITTWVMLRAPSFDCVYDWRLEQEHKLAQASTGAAIMSDADVARFIQFYERLTRHCLATLAPQMDIVFQLDGSRGIRSANGLDVR